MTTYFPFLFVILASFFLFIGIKVVLSKRPMFISSRYFFVFILIAFSPQFINSFNMLMNNTSSNIHIIFYLNPIMFTALLVFLWFQMKGYIAVGVSDDSFRNALHYSLNKNNLPFEEQLSAIKLTSIDTSVQVAIQSWIGAGQLKLKKVKGNDNGHGLLPKIIQGLNEYYNINDIKANNVTSVFYIIMGVFSLVFAVAFSHVFN